MTDKTFASTHKNPKKGRLPLRAVPVSAERRGTWHPGKGPRSPLRLLATFVLLGGACLITTGACSVETLPAEEQEPTCERGSLRCSCHDDESCDGDLTCVTGLCVLVSSTGDGDGDGAEPFSGGQSGDGDGDMSGTGGKATTGGSSGGVSASGGADASGGFGGSLLVGEARLLGYWPLDGTLVDATGQNPSGVFLNHPRSAVEHVLRFVDGFGSGQAVDLRGDGESEMPFIDTHLAFDSDSPRTYSVFVKTTDFAHELVWVGSGAPDEDPGSDGNRCYLGVQEETVFVGAGTTVYRFEETWPKQDALWHHYALRISGNGGTFDAFQDGVLVVSRAGYNGKTQSAPGEGQHGTSRGFLIGMGGGIKNHPSNAIIDDVAVFDGVLGDEEIRQIWEQGSVRNWLSQ